MEAQLFLADDSGSIITESNAMLWLYNPITPDLILKKAYDASLDSEADRAVDEVAIDAYTDANFFETAIPKLIQYLKIITLKSLLFKYESSTELWNQAFLQLSKNYTNDTHLLLPSLSPLPFSGLDAMILFLQKVTAPFSSHHSFLGYCYI